MLGRWGNEGQRVCLQGQMTLIFFGKQSLQGQITFMLHGGGAYKDKLLLCTVEKAILIFMFCRGEVYTQINYTLWGDGVSRDEL